MPKSTHDLRNNGLVCFEKEEDRASLNPAQWVLGLARELFEGLP
jgi:hypothetical protein